MNQNELKIEDRADGFSVRFLNCPMVAHGEGDVVDCWAGDDLYFESGDKGVGLEELLKAGIAANLGGTDVNFNAHRAAAMAKEFMDQRAIEAAEAEKNRHIVETIMQDSAIFELVGDYAVTAKQIDEYLGEVIEHAPNSCLSTLTAKLIGIYKEKGSL